MTALIDAPIKKKRISKKNKSAWRKTDIQDVEQFLEDQRLEERVGTFKDKADDELFVVEGSTAKPALSLLSIKQKRKMNALKPMRSLQALENTSKVEDPIVKRNHVKQKKNGRNIEEEVRNPTKGRHRQANADRGRYYEKLDERLAEKEGRKLVNKTAKNLWVEEDFRDQIPGLKDEKGWVSRDLAVHIAGNVGRKVVKVHSSLHHNTTKAKKFEAPHPGMSYNPSLKAHQELLQQVVEHEEGVIKKEQHLKRVTTSMFSKVTPEERDKRRLIEMSEGIQENEGEEEAEDDEKASAAYHTVNAPVENKKKSKQARNKELKQKELQRQHELKKALKKQTADLIRIKSIRAEIKEEAEDLNELKKRRKLKAERKKFEPKRLGRHKYEEPDVDVNMPEDLAGNLRNVKTESNLLTDRFKLLQKRNILPTTVAVSRKRSKVKRYPRNSHKEPGVSFQDLRDQRRAAAAAAKANKDTIKI